MQSNLGLNLKHFQQIKIGKGYLREDSNYNVFKGK